MRCISSAVLAGAAGVVLGAGLQMAPGADIPAVAVFSTNVTVSGISSGAYMAAQMHVAWSSSIVGAGILAGGPYWCAQDDVLIATTQCMSDGYLINVPYLVGIMENTAAMGFIDPLSNLRDSRVWMLSATNDSVVDITVVRANAAVYETFLADAGSQLRTVFDVTGEHSQLTADYGNPCTYLGSPYINNCGYDAAGEALQWLYGGGMAPPSAPATFTCQTANNVARRQNPNMSATAAADGTGDLPLCGDAMNLHPSAYLASGNGTLYGFDQGLFVGGGGWSSMWGLAQTAYVYIPNNCLANSTAGVTCTLHVAYHGCLMTQEDIGLLYETQGGYIPWADANNLVILFPQAISNLLNPKGCHDWWGYAGTAYASQLGTQVLAYKRIIDVLVGNPLTPNRTMTDFGPSAEAAVGDVNVAAAAMLAQAATAAAVRP